MRLRSLLAVALLACASVPAFAAEDPAQAIFARASAAAEAGDQAGLEAAGKEVDALLATNADSPDAHYVRAWIRSRLDSPDEAVAEYDTALRLDPTFAAAAYNAGVVLMGLHRRDDAIARFEKAIEIDPKHVDANYNLGQAWYDKKEFAKALVAWQRTLELTPDDFQAAKKVVQAYNGLGDLQGAARAREQAIDVWKRSTDPDVRKLSEFVFDQFDVPGWHVYAYEVFEHPEAKGYLYVFRLADANDHVAGSIRLEPFELPGHPYIIGIEKGGGMSSPGPAFDSLPSYDKLKPVVLEAIAKWFPPPAK